MKDDVFAWVLLIGILSVLGASTIWGPLVLFVGGLVLMVISFWPIL